MTIKDFLEKQEWIFAKTYAETAPHEYCLLKKVVGTEQEFRAATRYIKEKGFKAKYWSSPRNYLIVGDKMYWIMSDDPADAILINRCSISDYDITVTPRKEGYK